MCDVDPCVRIRVNTLYIPFSIHRGLWLKIYQTSLYFVGCCLNSFFCIKIVVLRFKFDLNLFQIAQCTNIPRCFTFNLWWFSYFNWQFITVLRLGSWLCNRLIIKTDLFISNVKLPKSAWLLGRWMKRCVLVPFIMSQLPENKDCNLYIDERRLLVVCFPFI